MTVEVDIDVVPNVDLNGDVDVESIVDLARGPRGQLSESSSTTTGSSATIVSTSPSTSTSLH
jgi:hypothetical protein